MCSKNKCDRASEWERERERERERDVKCVYQPLVSHEAMGWLRSVGSINYKSLLQNIVSFIGLFCKRDLWFNRSYSPKPPRSVYWEDVCESHYAREIKTWECDALSATQCVVLSASSLFSLYRLFYRSLLQKRESATHSVRLSASYSVRLLAVFLHGTSVFWEYARECK